MAHQISDQTLKFFTDCYERRVEDLLEDPDEVCEVADLPDYVQELAEVGRDIGLNFRDVCNRVGRRDQMERLAGLLLEAAQCRLDQKARVERALHGLPAEAKTFVEGT